MWTATRTSCPSERTPHRCPRRREVPAHGRAAPQSRSRAHRRSSHRRHRRELASCPPRAESSHCVVRCTRSPAAEKAMVPGGGAGDHPSTRQGITHLSGNSGDCSGHRNGRMWRHQTGEARATVPRMSFRSQSSTGTRSVMRAGHGYVSGLSALTSIIAMPVSSFDVVDGEHERAACADLHLIARLHGGAVSDRHDRTGACRFPSSHHNLSEAKCSGSGRSPASAIRPARSPPEPGRGCSCVCLGGHCTPENGGPVWGGTKISASQTMHR